MPGILRKNAEIAKQKSRGKTGIHTLLLGSSRFRGRYVVEIVLLSVRGRGNARRQAAIVDAELQAMRTFL